MLRYLKPAVFLASLAPLSWLAWRAFHGGLGANPIEKITHSTGDCTLTFLLITLSITPLRKLTHQYWLINLRRMLGLFAPGGTGPQGHLKGEAARRAGRTHASGEVPTGIVRRSVRRSCRRRCVGGMRRASPTGASGRAADRHAAEERKQSGAVLARQDQNHRSD